MRIIPYEPHHLAMVQAQSEQASELAMMSPTDAVSLKHAGPAFTGIDGDEIVGCVGLIKFWETEQNRYYRAWGWLGKKHPLAFVFVTRRIRNFLDAVEAPCRVEAQVRADFDKGCRWLDRIGFTRRATLPQYGPDGADYDLWDFVK